MRKARLVVLLIIGLFFLTVVTIAEEITLTTYYPAPYGEYGELRANKLGVGSGTDTSVLNDGDLEVSGRLRVKDSKDSWDSLLSGGIIKEKFLPYCPQEITSDVYTNGQSQATGCSFGGYTGYYNISKLTPESVKKGVSFGRGQTGTLAVGYTRARTCPLIGQCSDWCTVGTGCSNFVCIADTVGCPAGYRGSSAPAIYTFSGETRIDAFVACFSGSSCTGDEVYIRGLTYLGE